MCKKALLGILGLSLAWVLSAGLAYGQPAGTFGPGPVGPAPGFQGKFAAAKRSQLGPALGVDQRTVDKLIEIDQRYQPMREQLIRDIRAELGRLRQVMSQPNPPEREVQAILTSMKQKKQEMLNLQERKDQEEVALLTPVQQARYLMYLMSLVKEARSIKGGPGGGGAPFTPGQGPREIPVTGPPR